MLLGWVDDSGIEGGGKKKFKWEAQGKTGRRRIIHPL